MKNILRKLVLWFLCKLGRPIYSPSQFYLTDKFTCLECGKTHGELLGMQEDFENRVRVILHGDPDAEPPQGIIKMGS
jgi:hypothetical protein